MALWARWRNRRTPAGDGEQKSVNGVTDGTGEATIGYKEREGIFDAAGGKEVPGERVMELTDRQSVKLVEPRIGMTVLELAESNGVGFASHCRRGTCARCRCLVLEGGQYLSEPNEAETLRLEPEEIADGYRLGCQARVTGIGPMRIRHAPYF